MKNTKENARMSEGWAFFLTIIGAKFGAPWLRNDWWSGYLMWWAKRKKSEKKTTSETRWLVQSREQREGKFLLSCSLFLLLSIGAEEEVFITIVLTSKPDEHGFVIEFFSPDDGQRDSILVLVRLSQGLGFVGSLRVSWEPYLEKYIPFHIGATSVLGRVAGKDIVLTLACNWVLLALLWFIQIEKRRS